MIHARTLMVGMRVSLGYSSQKMLAQDSYSDEFTVEAVGFDWVILRRDNKAFSATFRSHEDSAQFMHGVEVL